MVNPKDNNYAYIGMKIPVSSANINDTGYMLNEPVKYTANTVISIMTVGNANLDGTTGTYYDNITGAADSGTLVKRITIKAQGSTSQGMVRMFLNTGSKYLMREIEVPAITQGPTVATFIAMIDELFYLKYGNTLRFSTQNSDTIIVTAEGEDISYPFPILA